MANVERSPLVGIIMGPDSDLKVMKPAGDILEHCDVPHEFRIKSAHHFL